VPQLAEALRATKETIYNDLRELHLQPHDHHAVMRQSRLAHLRSLVSAGHDPRDIAAAMQTSLRSLRDFAREQGVTLGRPARLAPQVPKSRGPRPALSTGNPRGPKPGSEGAARIRQWRKSVHQQQLDRLRAALAEGVAPTREAMAAHLGIGMARLARHLKDIGQTDALPTARAAETAARHAAERDAVRAAHAAGHQTPADVCRATGLSFDAVIRAFRLLGLSSNGQRSPGHLKEAARRRAVVAARLDRILSLIATGCTAATDLAAALGVSAKVIRIDLAALRASGRLPPTPAAADAVADGNRSAA
jgi:hypothetical protein